MNDDVIDLRGTRCPLTLLKIKQFLYQAKSVGPHTFLFDDAGTATDLPLYLSKEQNWHLCIDIQDQVYVAVCSRNV